MDRLRRVGLEDRTEHLDKLDLKDETSEMRFCKKDFLQQEPVMTNFHQPTKQPGQKRALTVSRKETNPLLQEARELLLQS